MNLGPNTYMITLVYIRIILLYTIYKYIYIYYVIIMPLCSLSMVGIQIQVWQIESQSIPDRAWTYRELNVYIPTPGCML